MDFSSVKPLNFINLRYLEEKLHDINMIFSSINSIILPHMNTKKSYNF